MQYDTIREDLSNNTPVEKMCNLTGCTSDLD